MASPSSNRVCRQVHRLFKVGVIGATSDAQLLEWLATRRDDAREAAFEELVIRHGPMVLRVCRGVLHDIADAEDAFQAVFLILAQRANSIRRGGSVASWLFGVAHRVASRAKGDSVALPRSRIAGGHRSKRELRGQPKIVRMKRCFTTKSTASPRVCGAAATLCYLEGLTYNAAAHQLGVSEGTIRGRLARARECSGAG